VTDDAPGLLASPARLADELAAAGLVRGGLVGLAVRVGAGAAVVAGGQRWCWPVSDPASLAQALAAVETALRPRWLWWDAATTVAPLVGHGFRPATSWDVAAVHRLLAGGSTDDPATVWAWHRGLDPSTAPRTGQLDLLSAAPASGGDGPRDDQADGDRSSDPEQPVEASGHLRAEWVDGGWGRSPSRLARWADLALAVQQAQRTALAARAGEPGVSGDPLSAAHAESAAALLCVELAHDGLPLDVPAMRSLVERSVGPPPRDAAEEARLRRTRDEVVLRHAPALGGGRVDLRNPAQVRQLLARVGIEVPDTRSWRLEPWRGEHPLVDALLTWRKADRIATTYGYAWLERHVAADGRLRGEWQASDGAAGRMTAGAGLHNLPAELRGGVAAAPGHALVRADLGQVEPRVLAAVSGDRALAAATEDDDLYAPVAARLGVERAVAKVAVLAAMYGQTSGAAGQALQGMDQAYPVAMRFLRRASDEGRAGRAVRTHGGRLVRMWATPPELDGPALQSAVAARGRFARNAVVQGSAAELFKAWAVTVRTALRPLGAEVVLCLHDELLVHAPAEVADDVARLLVSCLDRVGAAWAPGARVRFVADVRVLHRWSEAKDR
jgi:DNA polymerase-1